MSSKKGFVTVTNPKEIAEIEKATQEVLEGKRPSGPPASGSAGVPWGGADAMDYWRDDSKIVPKP